MESRPPRAQHDKKGKTNQDADRRTDGDNSGADYAIVETLAPGFGRRAARRRRGFRRDLPTKKTPPAAEKPNCYASFWTWLDSTAADCPLSAYGITVYGTIDMGGGYESHASKFNTTTTTALRN